MTGHFSFASLTKGNGTFDLVRMYLTCQLKASAPHLVWAFGHFLTFFAGIRYWLAVATFSWSGYDMWYRVAYLGAIVSYGVVIYKSFGVR